MPTRRQGSTRLCGVDRCGQACGLRYSQGGGGVTVPVGAFCGYGKRHGRYDAEPCTASQPVDRVCVLRDAARVRPLDIAGRQLVYAAGVRWRWRSRAGSRSPISAPYRGISSKLDVRFFTEWPQARPHLGVTGDVSLNGIRLVSGRALDPGNIISCSAMCLRPWLS